MLILWPVYFQAFEGLGEIQVERSPELSLSPAEINDFLFEGDDENEGQEFSGAVGSSSQDDAWISPPDSIFSSSPSSVLSSSDEQSSTQISKEPTNTTPSVVEGLSQGEGALSNQNEPTGVQPAYFLEKEKFRELCPLGSENKNLNLENQSQLGSRVIPGENLFLASHRCLGFTHACVDFICSETSMLFHD